MPVYEYQCKSCERVFEKTLRLSERNEPQVCSYCGHEDTTRIMSLCGFVLKGDGWPGKNYKIKGQMREKNQRLSRKENERRLSKVDPQLAPNVGGERVDSWSEAKKLAVSKGKDTTGYDKMIHKEKKLSKGVCE